MVKETKTHGVAVRDGPLQVIRLQNVPPERPVRQRSRHHLALMGHVTSRPDMSCFAAKGDIVILVFYVCTTRVNITLIW